MFVDEAIITVSGGTGGPGKVAFFPNRRGPSGGAGGQGGNVYIKGHASMTDLHTYVNKSIYKAEDGVSGETFERAGAAGKDLVLSVPIGTHVIREGTTETLIEIFDSTKQTILVRGGIGGRGNVSFATSIYQTPRHAETGQPGETVSLSLVLKLIADVGLIGLPNAGKSSLLNEFTSANVKTAAYPFTTLEPYLGVFAHRFGGFEHKMVMADIPGLIEGASKGKGLGVKFLKHIEKVEVLLHCVSSESKDVLEDYETVIKEMKEFNPRLLEKKQIILLTKTDLIDLKIQKKLIDKLKKTKHDVYPVSIYNPDQFLQLKKYLIDLFLHI